MPEGWHLKGKGRSIVKKKNYNWLQNKWENFKSLTSVKVTQDCYHFQADTKKTYLEENNILITKP